jgi:hypothetical protein
MSFPASYGLHILRVAFSPYLPLVRDGYSVDTNASKASEWTIEQSSVQWAESCKSHIF